MSFEDMFNRVAARHDELRDALSGGQVEAHAFAKMSKEYSELNPIAEAIAELRKARAERQDLAAMLADPEMKDLAEAELEALDRRLPELEHGIQVLLLPKDEADEKNAILEVRAGTGGDEAALFAAELFQMYQRYAALRGWRFETMDVSETGIGGYKEATASILSLIHI